jgi:TolB protein
MNFIPGKIKHAVENRGRAFIAVVLVMAFTTSCSRTGLFTGNKTQLPNTGAPLGLIAYDGIDGNIYTIDRTGKQKTAITQDSNLTPNIVQEGRIYQYPTWAPDGRTLAFMGLTRTSQGVIEARLFTASSDGKKLVEAFNSTDYTPFYLFWSPNSDYVTFLTSAVGQSDLVLYIAAAAGGDSKVIGTGQPFYWDWSPDNQTIIVHTGGSASQNPDARLSLYRLDGSIQKTELDLKPGAFQAPAWSPGGDEMALTTQTDAGAQQLLIAGRDGSIKRVLTQLSGPVAFAWSPKGDHLAYTTSDASDTSGMVKHLMLLDPTRPEGGKEVVQGVVVTFFWSPDSQKIAYFILNQGSPSGLTQNIAQTSPKADIKVFIFDLVSGDTRQVTAFVPTPSFVQVFPFFDQYQRSGTIWSPDSKYLVIAGVDDNGSPGIFVVDANGGQSQKIADGDLAFWAWK